MKFCIMKPGPPETWALLYVLYRIICSLLQVNCTNLAIGLTSKPSSLVVSFAVTSLTLSV